MTIALDIYKKDFIFTSEYVSNGHPDKIADQISDFVLDFVLKKFKPEKLKIAIETMIINHIVKIAGEISKKLSPEDLEEIRYAVFCFLKYDKFLGKYFLENDPEIELIINIQSPDINFLVDNSYTIEDSKNKNNDIGAGDQGMMFGFACSDTKDLMPATIYFAKKILDAIFKPEDVFSKEFLNLEDKLISEKIKTLGPDAKSQVSVEYRDSKPFMIRKILISIQHPENILFSELKQILFTRIISSLPANLICLDKANNDIIYDEDINFEKESKLYNFDNIKNKDNIFTTEILINPAGSFILGGPNADTGVTGRKIIVDTYGGFAPHGGGAFSGKDPTKLDRSGAYITRYIAKNLVASSVCKKCLVSVSYVIGLKDPFSFSVNTFGTIDKNLGICDKDLEIIIQKLISLRPSYIIEKFDLWNINFLELCQKGHFGNDIFAFEKTDLKDELHMQIASYKENLLEINTQSCRVLSFE
jgi:S-adenosylmethionine synthetase